MERRATSDEDLAREHRSDDPLGPADQPEGAQADAANPSASHMDRPLVGRSGQQDEKVSRGQEEQHAGKKARNS